MKHGPIALIDEHTPVVFVATGAGLRQGDERTSQEIKARGAGDRRRHRGRRGGRRRGRRRRSRSRTLDLQPLLAVSRCSCWPTTSRAARLRRGQAPQPRQERHRRVTGIGLDLLEIERLRSRSGVAPGSRSGCSPTRARLRVGAAPVGCISPPGSAQGGGGEGARPDRLELSRRRGRGHGRRAARCRSAARGRSRRSSAGWCGCRSRTPIELPRRGGDPPPSGEGLADHEGARPDLRGGGDARGRRLSDRGARGCRRST